MTPNKSLVDRAVRSLTAPKIESVPIGALKPYNNNPRKHSKKQVAKIARSIERFGFVGAILCDQDGNIICGHGRLKAAQQLGLAEVPV